MIYDSPGATYSNPLLDQQGQKTFGGGGYQAPAPSAPQQQQGSGTGRVAPGIGKWESWFTPIPRFVMPEGGAPPLRTGGSKAAPRPWIIGTDRSGPGPWKPGGDGPFGHDGPTGAPETPGDSGTLDKSGRFGGGRRVKRDNALRGEGSAIADDMKAIQEEERERLRELFRRVYGREPTPQELMEFWEEGLDAMEAANGMGDDPRDPWYWLEQRAGNTEAEEAEKNKPRTEIHTSIRKALTDAATARVLANETLKALLGRDATPEERAAFQAALNAEEEANPLKTVTTTEIDPEAGTTTETVEESGQEINPGAFAEEYAEEQHGPEQQAYWSATTGADVMQALISGF